jgi:hypothetical protein
LLGLYWVLAGPADPWWMQTQWLQIGGSKRLHRRQHLLAVSKICREDSNPWRKKIVQVNSYFDNQPCSHTFRSDFFLKSFSTHLTAIPYLCAKSFPIVQCKLTLLTPISLKKGMRPLSDLLLIISMLENVCFNHKAGHH